MVAGERISVEAVYIGIDPGLDGALAFIWYCSVRDRPPVTVVDVADAPTVTVEKSNRKNKREYVIAEMASQLRTVLDYPALPYAVIEKVHAMPGQGVSSMFSMGYGCGLWEGLLAAFRIPYQRVTPQAWQKVMLAGEGRGKDAARLAAQRLYPKEAYRFEQKKDDGRADALLMAEYCRRITRGQS